jgi:pyruvate/2-oxoacid:ferredoxin oxidoreductase alpha subunit
VVFSVPFGLRYLLAYDASLLRDVLQDVRAVGVIDFSYSMGSPDHAGAFFNDVRSTLYESDMNLRLLTSSSLEAGSQTILAANQADMGDYARQNPGSPLLDRLMLNLPRIKDMARGL